MKRTFILLTAISVFAGAGYAVWAFTPIGRNTMITWMLNRWQRLAQKRNEKLKLAKLRAALQKLEYEDLVLLVKFTRLAVATAHEANEGTPETKLKRERLYAKAEASGLIDRIRNTELAHTIIHIEQ